MSLLVLLKVNNPIEGLGDWFKDNPEEIALFFVWLLVAVLIVVVGFWIVNKIGRLFHRGLTKLNRFDDVLVSFFVAMIKFGLKAVVLIVALGFIGLEMTSFTAILAAAVIAIALALNGTLQNVAAGLLILFTKPFIVGHFIEAAGEAGHVKSLTIFKTNLVTLDGKRVEIANYDVYHDNIVNYTVEGKLRVQLSIGIDYSDDVELAMRTITQAMEENQYVMEKPAPMVGLAELGDNSVNFWLRAWTAPETYFDCGFSLTRDIKRRFDDVGLNFPFPQRDVHLDMADGAPMPPLYKKLFDSLEEGDGASDSAAETGTVAKTHGPGIHAAGTM